MTGMWRVHHALSHVLQLQVAGEHVKATALTVQLSKALHQTALDQGTWKVAAKMLPFTDPLQRVEFAGSAREMKAIQKHLKGLKELQGGQKNPKTDTPADPPPNKEG